MLSFLGGATLIPKWLNLQGQKVSDDPTNTDFGKNKDRKYTL